MGSHPINLLVRFLLELFALISYGIYGWRQADGWLRFVMAIGLPILMATVWAVFNVPHDASRSGNAPIPIPGLLRLLLELVFFAFAVWCLLESNFVKSSMVFALIVLLHYIVSYDRIRWLLTRNTAE